MDEYKLIAIVACIILVLIIIVLSSRSRIVRTYKRYMRVDNQANLTGEQFAVIAKEHLDLKGLKFALTKQKLGDAYSSKYKTLIISEEVCKTASLASLTIVAHELGHAQQHQGNNILFVLTRFLRFITNFTNILIVPLLVLGMCSKIFSYPNADIGYILILTSIILFAIHVLNQILTVPLEYDASRRALKYLKENKFLSSNEHKKAKKLLSIAAQTYIANLLDGILILNIKKKRKRK